MEEFSNYNRKAILFGSYAVGKTSLIKMLTDNIFIQKYRSTIGFSITKENFTFNGNKKTSIFFWDFGGQILQRDNCIKYLTSASVAIIIYDITRRKTFNEIFELYKHIINNIKNQIHILLLGNKTDLKDKREVSFQEGKKIAEKIGATFFEISVKNSKNLKNTFYKFVKKLNTTEIN